MSVLDKKGKTVKTFKYGEKEGIVSEKHRRQCKNFWRKLFPKDREKTRILKDILSGERRRRLKRFQEAPENIFLRYYGFAPADDPQILGMVIIHDPQGIYYGGTIAAPVLRDIYDNVLPYLGIEKK